MSTLLVLFDTDDGFDARFKKKLEEEELEDSYAIQRVVPDTTLSTDELVKKCLREAGQLVAGNVVSAFFVDIVIYEKGPLDTAGLAIANQLHAAFPNIPVFSITSKLTHEETYDPYYDVFSEATLEQLDGVFAKSYLEGKHFSAKRIKKIFAKAHERRVKQSVLVSPMIHEDLLKKCENIKKVFDAEHIDAFTADQIDGLGACRFWLLLENLLPNAEGTIKTISPGRSGAFVFKATAKIKKEHHSTTHPKSWIIKVSTDRELVSKEAKNHSELVITGIERSTIPRLLHPEPKGDNNLWAIAFEYEGEADTLLKVVSSNANSQACNKIAENVIDVLIKMYGDPLKLYKKVWPVYFALSPTAQLKILSFLSENKQVLKNAKIECIDRLESFVKSNGDSLNEYEVEVDTRHIHGDLNSGNILVTPTSDVIFIDFASRHQDHVAKDIAKLERDLLFRVADAYMPEYYSWNSIELLNIMSKPNETDFFMSAIEEDRLKHGHAPIILMIRSLRSGLKRISPTTQPKEYLCALLHYCLLALAHPAISINRKAIVMVYANNIIDGLLL